MLTLWKLDRLGRSVSHLVDLVDDLGRRGVQLRSLTEGLDTTSAGGRVVFHLMAARFDDGHADDELPVTTGAA